MPSEQPKEEPSDAVTNKKEAIPKKKYSKEKLKLMQIEEKTLDENAPQHLQSVESPQFSKIKLKKSSIKPKQDTTTITLPKVQLKSRVRYINDWPPQIITPAVTFLGSIRQNGDLSRNVKEALKLKKKVIKVPKIPDFEKVELEKPEQFEFSAKLSEVPREYQVDQPEDFGDKIPEEIKELIQEEKPQHEILELTPTAPGDIRPKSNTPELKNLIEEHELKSVSETPEAPIVKEIKPDLPIEEEISEGTPKETVEKLVKPKKKQKTKVELPMPEVTDETEPHKKESVSEFVEQEPVPESKPQEKETTPEIIQSIDSESKDIQDVIEPLTTQQEVEKRTVIPDEVTENLPIEKDTKVRKKTKKVIKTKTDQKPEAPEEPSVPEEKKVDLDDEPIVLVREDDITGIITPKVEEYVQPKTNEEEQPNETLPDKKLVKQKPKLTSMKIEKKVLKINKAQHAENTDGPQFANVKLKKLSISKPKSETQATALPKFQLKSRITYINDWPPEIIKPPISFLGSVKQNGILSRNVKEASKIKKKIYKQPDLPDLERTELEKPVFGYEDTVDAIKQSESKPEENDELTQDEPEQFTIKPKRPSVKKTEEITEEITIKKKLKPVRKSSIILPEITEPETVTFRPKSTKTKEDVEQEFNIQLDSYAEEEISMSSKVKLKPQRQPTFSEEANETSIKFYEEEDGPDIVEIIEGDVEENEKTTQVLMPLKKVVSEKEKTSEDIMSSVTMSRPKTSEEPSEMVQDISIKLDRKPKYTVDDQEEVSFDVKPLTEQYSTEEMSLSSKIRLKPKKKVTLSEAADETSIQITQEVENDNEPEEIVLSEAESEENVEMVIRRKPKKPAYEVSDIEELSVEFKPKPVKDETYHEEQLTISAKRKPRKPSQLQGIVL